MSSNTKSKTRAALRVLLAALCSSAMLVMSGHAANAQTAGHPLDALTAQEYWAIFDTLQASGRVNSDTDYPSISLHEPPKVDVLRWKPGQTFRREASVVVRQGAKTFEVLVDVSAKKVISWTRLQGIQPNETDVDSTGMNDAIQANRDWQAAMRRRGITNSAAVTCVGVSAGYFGTAEEQGRRLFRVSCYDRHNVYEPDSRLIEGLVVVWDANQHKILRVIDTGVVPIPRANGNYDESSVGPLRKPPAPLTIQQPLGPSFRVSGHEVAWQKWQFHFRIDRRVGLVISNVRYMDGQKSRSILYEGSLSEIFVPYMDPSENWYWATYFDAGEFATGFSSTLEPGSDCPENAVYFDQVFADDQAMPLLSPRAACLFERYAGDIAWRHTGRADPVESRKRRDLVLRTIGTFGNYDYIFDWVFRQDGSIDVAVGATGIDELKPVIPRSASDTSADQAQAHGRFIAEHIVAPYHDHFFSFRLDFDIDGANNSFVRDRLRVQRPAAPSLRKSMWVVDTQVAQTEKQAKLRLSLEQPETWRVINPNVKNVLGYPVGYEIVPGANAMSLLAPEDYPQRRAGFTDYQLWVTPLRENERFAAGDYPLQSRGGDGLPAWTSANRPIENTDIVVWYTMGFHHLPSAEDFPVLPTSWHDFQLRPYNFFSRNPAIDLPKQP